MHVPGEDDIGASTPKSMEDMLSQEEHSYLQPKRGEIRTGQVVSVGPNEIVVDVGAKREGVVSPQDLERLSAEEQSAISVGDQVSVYVVNPEDRDGNTVVSIFLAQIEQDWQQAGEYLESKQIIEGKVIGYNKGGLVVPFGKIRGFVPASQVVGFPRRLSPNEKIARLAEQVGREIVVQIIEVDRRRRRLIMSEQAAQGEWREQQRRKLMDSLVEGQVVHGVVISLANSGAFVDLGGTDGFIHISELAWHRIRHPREVVQVGDEVDVYVLKVDRANSKIGLSLRRLRPNPWSLVDTKYSIGQRVEGTITNVIDYGAFAHLEEDIEGLIHISELSDVEITHPNDVVKRGDRYLLEIIKIEPERQRIALSLKRVPSDEQAAWRAVSAFPVAKTETRRLQLETLADEEPVAEYAIARFKDHNEGQPLYAGLTYVVEAGVSRQSRKALETLLGLLPTAEKGTRFDIVVYGEDMDVSPSWFQPYIFDPDTDDLIEFRLRPRTSGHKVILVEFYYQYHWLQQIKFVVRVITAPHKSETFESEGATVTDSEKLRP